MQNAKGGFVARQSKLPLKLHRRHARRLACDEVGGPELDAERRMAAFHDGADQKAGLAAAGAALQNAGAGDNAGRLGDQIAMPAYKTVSPAGAPEIGGTCSVFGKQPLKIRKRLRKSKVVPLVNVHVHDGKTLDLAGVCVNRIGMEQTIARRWFAAVGRVQAQTMFEFCDTSHKLGDLLRLLLNQRDRFFTGRNIWRFSDHPILESETASRVQ